MHRRDNDSPSVITKGVGSWYTGKGQGWWAKPQAARHWRGGVREDRVHHADTWRHMSATEAAGQPGGVHHHRRRRRRLRRGNGATRSYYTHTKQESHSSNDQNDKRRQTRESVVRVTAKRAAWNKEENGGHSAHLLLPPECQGIHTVVEVMLRRVEATVEEREAVQ